jgi:hypothetical protein
MKKLESKTEYALEQLDYEPYREKLSSMESELHKSRENLIEAEKESLQDLGYKPIKMEGVILMAPVGMTIRQLRVSLQQLPTPEQHNGNKIMKQLVEEEDLQEAYKNDKYKDVVDKRQTIVDKIMQTYREFWKEEVKPAADTDAEKIIFMLAGIGKDIRARKLSKITGIPERQCGNYKLNDNVVEFKEKT